ncbi:hypothetical protein TNCT_538681 [Trichonephila clavata]|uniref:Uncharacterized protein n=1 Tax=Trichonephila clavata TaxID=2740835 RepID=A0A8X6GLG9_TRICU|nr:hypothetical protein TNCT_538681 [Trichonephila clavata]
MLQGNIVRFEGSLESRICRTLPIISWQRSRIIANWLQDIELVRFPINNLGQSDWIILCDNIPCKWRPFKLAGTFRSDTLATIFVVPSLNASSEGRHIISDGASGNYARYRSTHILRQFY